MIREFKTIEKDEVLDYLGLLMDFYVGPYPANYHIALTNSSYICCCLEDGVVIGACRLITDYSRHTFVVDLSVKKEKRKTGVGRQIMKESIKIGSELRTGLSLSTDPRKPWLKGFYENLGFSRKEGNHFFSYPVK